MEIEQNVNEWTYVQSIAPENRHVVLTFHQGGTFSYRLEDERLVADPPVQGTADSASGHEIERGTLDHPAQYETLTTLVSLVIRLLQYYHTLAYPLNTTVYLDVDHTEYALTLRGDSLDEADLPYREDGNDHHDPVA